MKVVIDGIEYVPKYESDIKVNDTVIIVDNEYACANWINFFEEYCPVLEIAARYAYGDLPKENDKMGVFDIYKVRDRTIYLLKSKTNGKVYLMEREGIEKS